MVKDLRSFGGFRVRNNIEEKLKESEYYQEIIDGESISIQFFCKNNKIQLLSICNQFFKENNFNPYIIDSIVTKKVNSQLFIKFQKICIKIANLYKLNGINNLDLIIEKNSGKIFIVELNTRPGLSTNMIFKIHKNIFKNDSFKKKYLNTTYFYGTKILYSRKNLLINKKNFKYIKSLASRSSFSELPIIRQIIRVNEPICLIHQKSKEIEILRDNLEKMSYKVLNNLN